MMHGTPTSHTGESTIDSFRLETEINIHIRVLYCSDIANGLVIIIIMFLMTLLQVFFFIRH